MEEQLDRGRENSRKPCRRPCEGLGESHHGGDGGEGSWTGVSGIDRMAEVTGCGGSGRKINRNKMVPMFLTQAAGWVVVPSTQRDTERWSRGWGQGAELCVALLGPACPWDT